MKRNIAVFCGSSTPRNSKIVDAARELGYRIAEAGDVLVYGGSNLGLMGVVSAAALDAGGEVIGVIPRLFSEDIIQSQAVTELVRVCSMGERKERIMEMCDAFVALPGGIGTIDEISEVVAMNQLQIRDGRRVLDGTYRNKLMILLNLDGYYDPFFEQIRHAKEEGLMRSDAGLVDAATVDEVLCHIC
jgi:uncharacterized protein (TIGR00730 family)